MTSGSPCVVDASAGVKWLIAEDFSEQADALLDSSLRGGRPILVPAHFPSDVMNAIFQRVRSTSEDRHLSEERGWTALGQFLAIPVVLHSSAELYERTYAFARQHRLDASYDSLYVVLAAMAGCELWTADQRLLNAVGRAAPWVRWIGDFPLS